MKKLCHSNAKREGKKTAGEMLDNFSKRNLCHAIFECATRTMNEGHRTSSYEPGFRDLTLPLNPL